MEVKAEVFNKLPCAMHIALPKGENGINDNDFRDMKGIEEKVTEFRKYLPDNNRIGISFLSRKV